MRTRNKTIAAWLAVLLGSLGVHRFYLRGLGDWIGWVFPLPTALGWWGVDRVLTYGQDDKLSWLLIPLLGISLAAARRILRQLAQLVEARDGLHQTEHAAALQVSGDDGRWRGECRGLATEGADGNRQLGLADA